MNFEFSDEQKLLRDQARGFLAEAGVTAIVRADDGGGALAAPLTYSLGSFAEVFVAVEDVERRRRNARGQPRGDEPLAVRDDEVERHLRIRLQREERP